MGLFNDQGQLSRAELAALEALAQQQQVQAVSSAYAGQLVPTADGTLLQPYQLDQASLLALLFPSGTIAIPFVGARVYASASQQIGVTPGFTDRLPFDTVDYAVGPTFLPPYQLVAPVAGYYEVGALTFWGADSAHNLNPYWVVMLRKNGSNANILERVSALSPTGTFYPQYAYRLQLTTKRYLAAGDYVEVVCFATHTDLVLSGPAVDAFNGGIWTGETAPSFWMTLLGS